MRCPGCRGFHATSAELRECVARGGHSCTNAPRSGTARTTDADIPVPPVDNAGPPDPERIDGQVWMLGWECVCGWKWISQTDARPTRCPHCKTRRWAAEVLK